MSKTVPLTKAPLYGSETHRGVVNKPNEDRRAIFRAGPGDPEAWAIHPENSLYVAVVADGVTSQAAGAQASQIAVDTLQQSLQQHRHGLLPDEVPSALNEAIHTANRKIVATTEQNPEQRGMSTTIVVAAVFGRTLFIAHIGDSRAYLIRGNEIHRLTVDHTWVQQALDVGRLDENEARTHPNRHVLTQHLGTNAPLQVDHKLIALGSALHGDLRKMKRSLTLQPGDTILLCSDGVSDKVRREELQQIVAQNWQAPGQAARSLVRRALAKHEGDNITAALLTMPDSPKIEPERRFLTSAALSRTVITLLSLLLVVALGLVLRGGFGGPSPNDNGTDGESGSTPITAEIASAITATVASVTAPEITSTIAITSEATDVVLQPPTSTIGLMAATATLSTNSTPSATLSSAGGITTTQLLTETPTLAVPTIFANETPLLTATPIMLTSTATAVPVASPTVTVISITQPTTPTATAVERTATAIPTATPSLRVTPSLTVTLEPTATWLATNASTPSVTPTATIIATPQPSSTPQPSLPTTDTATLTATVAIALGACENCSVVVIGPTDPLLSGRQEFSWSADFALGDAYLYELVFWGEGETAMANGRSPIGAGADTTISLNINEAAFTLQLQGDRTYQWGVLLVEAADPIKRIKYLGGGVPFQIQFDDNRGPKPRATPRG